MLFCITLCECCICALELFLTSALISDLFDITKVLEGFTAPVQLVVLLLLTRGSNALFAGIG